MKSDSRARRAFGRGLLQGIDQINDLLFWAKVFRKPCKHNNHCSFKLVRLFIRCIVVRLNPKYMTRSRKSGQSQYLRDNIDIKSQFRNILYHHLACVELDQVPRKWVCDARATAIMS